MTLTPTLPQPPSETSKPDKLAHRRTGRTCVNCASDTSVMRRVKGPGIMCYKCGWKTPLQEIQ